MGTRKQTVSYCDVCNTEDANLTQYRLGKVDGTLQRFDLCPTHAKPLESLLAPSKARKRRSSRVVVTDPSSEIRRSDEASFSA